MPAIAPFANPFDFCLTALADAELPLTMPVAKSEAGADVMPEVDAVVVPDAEGVAEGSDPISLRVHR
jgi:hypothetical protein